MRRRDFLKSTVADAVIPTDEVVMTTTSSEDVVPELWQGR